MSIPGAPPPCPHLLLSLLLILATLADGKPTALPHLFLTITLRRWKPLVGGERCPQFFMFLPRRGGVCVLSPWSWVSYATALPTTTKMTRCPFPSASLQTSIFCFLSGGTLTLGTRPPRCGAAQASHAGRLHTQRRAIQSPAPPAPSPDIQPVREGATLTCPAQQVSWGSDEPSPLCPAWPTS